LLIKPLYHLSLLYRCCLIVVFTNPLRVINSDRLTEVFISLVWLLNLIIAILMLVTARLTPITTTSVILVIT
jgi:hypothetical protein